MRVETQEIVDFLDSLRGGLPKVAAELVQLRQEKVEAIKVLRYSQAMADTLDCECDSYNGFTCGLHEWKEKLDQALTTLEGGEEK